MRVFIKHIHSLFCFYHKFRNTPSYSGKKNIGFSLKEHTPAIQLFSSEKLRQAKNRDLLTTITLR